jgi:SNF2 family DNA or RNA helicase
VKYEYKTQPFRHQERVFNRSKSLRHYAFFLEMGTGKSKVTVDTMSYLYESGKIDTVLIVAPKGVYENWIKNEIPKHMPDRIEPLVVKWQPNFTKTFKEQMHQVATRSKRKDKKLHVLVMNVEALSTRKGIEVGTYYLSQNPDNLIIVDESTTIKNKDAERTKSIIKLGELGKYKRILTGSPVTKSPLDLFSQCKFLDPNILGFDSYYAFRNRYALMKRMSFGGKSFDQIIGYRRIEELQAKIHDYSTRILKEDCLDLPDKLYQKRYVPLSADQKKVYEQMRTLALAQIDNGELATTTSVLTQIMRLQQICCGFLPPDDGQIKELENGRLKELLSILEEVDGKVIIWATWTHDIKKIKKAIAEKYGEESVATFYGDTPQDKRQEIVDRFQDHTDFLRFFVGQPKTGGFGLTLTEAKTVIYYSNSYDLEIRLQSEDRAHRIGQESNVTYIDIVCPDTVDEKIIDALQDKVDLATKVFGEETRQWLQS